MTPIPRSVYQSRVAVVLLSLFNHLTPLEPQRQPYLNIDRVLLAVTLPFLQRVRPGEALTSFLTFFSPLDPSILGGGPAPCQTLYVEGRF